MSSASPGNKIRSYVGIEEGEAKEDRVSVSRFYFFSFLAVVMVSRKKIASHGVFSYIVDIVGIPVLPVEMHQAVLFVHVDQSKSRYNQEKKSQVSNRSVFVPAF